MKNQKIIAITAIVLMIASMMLMTNEIVKAAAPTVPTSGPLAGDVSVNQTVVSAHLSFRPNPVGVGQPVLVNVWTSPAPGTNRNHPHYLVTITHPDGTKDVVDKPSYVADGTNWFEFTPDVAGAWTIQFAFPGTYFPAGTYQSGVYLNTSTNLGSLALGASGPSSYAQAAYYMPDTTPVQNLTVQQDMVGSWPAAPLPTDYWTRPVSFNMREWWPILGAFPWYGPSGVPDQLWQQYYPNTSSVYNPRSQFTPWVQGPNSCHVVWKQMRNIDGIVGGDSTYGALGFELNGYGGKPSIIYDGRAYQTISKVNETGLNSLTYWQSYDIRTGQLFWERPMYPGETAPTILEYTTVSYSGSGVIGADITPNTPVLLSIGSSALRTYNPLTGAMTGNYSISPLTTGTYYMNGYCLSIQDLGAAAGANRYRLINWTTQGTTANLTTATATRIAPNGNTSYALSALPSIVDYSSGYGAAVSDVSDAGTGSYTKMRIIGYNLWTGAMTFNTTINEPQYSGSANIADHGKIAVLSANGYYIAFDLATGKQAWQSEKMDYPWDSSGFGTYGVQSAYGMLYREAYSGIYAFDWNTGKIVWKFEDQAAFPYEGSYTLPNGTTTYPFDDTAIIVDGKMYVYNGEHTPNVPFTRGWRTYAINATNGQQIWAVSIPGSSYFSSTDLVAAEGYLSLGGADGYQYWFGKGLSATTVTASPKVVADGSQVLIEGTVLDQSPAQLGTPCVSDASMATAMNHIHQQFPINGITGTETITGVPLTLTAIGTDGSVIPIGTVTTNGYYGTYSYAWQPTKQDTYTITASFAATDSYGSSSAATSVVVGAAALTPTATPTQIATAITDYTLTIVGMGIAVIIAVAIVGLLILRKRS